MRKLKRNLAHAANTAVGIVAICIVSVFIGGYINEKTVLDTDAKKEGIIVIDAGHGGVDGGAVGTNSKVSEAELNLAVSNYLKENLEAKGYSTTLTRSTDEALASGKQADMRARKAIMNADGVALVVSIHMNRFTDSAVSGPMAFYMQGSSDGERLANCIISELCVAADKPNRKGNPGDYYMIRESDSPAVIVECGFLSNPNDEALLQTAEHQKKLAEAISNGIIAYLSSNANQ